MKILLTRETRENNTRPATRKPASFLKTKPATFPRPARKMANPHSRTTLATIYLSANLLLNIIRWTRLNIPFKWSYSIVLKCRLIIFHSMPSFHTGALQATAQNWKWICVHAFGRKRSLNTKPAGGLSWMRISRLKDRWCSLSPALRFSDHVYCLNRILLQYTESCIF